MRSSLYKKMLMSTAICLGSLLFGGEELQQPVPLPPAAMMLNPGTTDYSMLTPGDHKHGGVVWQLTGQNGVPAGIPLQAGAVGELEIPVSMTVDGLWLLFAADAEGLNDPNQKTDLGTMTVETADGKSYEIKLVFNDMFHKGTLNPKDMKSMLKLDPKPFKVLSGYPVWHEKDGEGGFSVLYASRWYAPVPKSKITSIKFKAIEDAPGTPILFGITAFQDSSFELDGEAWSFRDFGHSGKTFSVQPTAEGAIAVPYYSNTHFSQLVFRDRPVKGDFTYQAKLESLSIGGTWMYADLTARDKPMQRGRNEGAAYVATTFCPSGTEEEHKTRKSLFYETGPVINGQVHVHDLFAPNGATLDRRVQVPGYLKLVRSGDVFTGYFSSDGETWEKIGEQKKDLPESVYVGLNTSSAHSVGINTIRWSEIKLMEGAAND